MLNRISPRKRGFSFRDNHMRRSIFLMLVAIFLSLSTGCERLKTNLDRELDRLCAMDGGIHVYEKVYLHKENFDQDGDVFPQYRHLFLENNHLGPAFTVEEREEIIVKGDPTLKRNSVEIIRNSDKKILGKWVNYSKYEGDFYGPWESSSKSCDLSLFPHSLVRSIFIKNSE